MHTPQPNGSDFDRIYQRLRRDWGELLAPRVLWRELGYNSALAARTARQRKKLPVRTFQIPGRKGYFARSDDVARWLSDVARSKP